MDWRLPLLSGLDAMKFSREALEGWLVRSKGPLFVKYCEKVKQSNHPDMSWKSPLCSCVHWEETMVLPPLARSLLSLSPNSGHYCVVVGLPQITETVWLWLA